MTSCPAFPLCVTFMQPESSSATCVAGAAAEKIAEWRGNCISCASATMETQSEAEISENASKRCTESTRLYKMLVTPAVVERSGAPGALDGCRTPLSAEGNIVPNTAA